jgi:hypothetical protein
MRERSLRSNWRNPHSSNPVMDPARIGVVDIRLMPLDASQRSAPAPG